MSKEGNLLDSEKNVMEKWVITATELLTTQAAETKETKGIVQKLKTELEKLPEQFQTQYQQLAVHDRDIYELQQRIPAISDVKGFEKIQTDFKELKLRINTTPVISEAPPETLLTELKAWEAELKRQQESKEKISVTPTLRKKYEPTIEKLKTQQNQCQNLRQQLTTDWASYRAIRTRMEKPLTEMELQLKKQLQDTNSIKTWVNTTQEQLKSLETEKGEAQEQLAKLQTQLTNWSKQLEEKGQPKPSLVSECLKVAKTIYERQQKDIQSAQSEEGDEDGALAEAIIEIGKKIEMLNSIEQRFLLYVKVIEDQQKNSPTPTTAAPLSQNPYTTLPAPKPLADQKQVEKLLQLVAEGEQDQAEEMLKKDKNLLLVAGTITDLSDREFKQITAFQYALWALDWHMWTMIQKYLPQEAQAEQFAALESKGTVHGKHYDIKPLTDALQMYVDNAAKWNYDQRAENQWCKVVGGEQKLLPAHVVNEYCRLDRPFFCQLEGESKLPRTREVDVWNKTQNRTSVKGSWFVAPLSKDGLGVNLAFCRYIYNCARGWLIPSGLGDFVGCLPSIVTIPHDLKALQSLWKSRTQQLESLKSQLLSATRQTQTLGAR